MNGKAFAIMAIVSALLVSACWTSDGPAPSVRYGQMEGAGSTGAMAVRPGDTVGVIAARYRLEVQDIIVANDLSPPYVLNPGQRLLLPPPRTYKVRDGDTIYGVSRLFSVSTTQIARMNSLYSPFVLESGQVLRMPVVTHRPLTGRGSTSSGDAIDQEPLATSPSGAFSGGGAIEREELPPPEISGASMEAAPPRIASASLSARVPDATPPRSGGKFLQPVGGQIISSYGPKPDGLHNDGINIRAPHGAPVRAAENGVVVYADNMKGYGKMILIRHADKWITAYAHMDSFHVARGDTIRRGQTIGTVGSTGSVREPQLHFEVRRGTSALNPEKFM